MIFKRDEKKREKNINNSLIFTPLYDIMNIIIIIVIKKILSIVGSNTLNLLRDSLAFRLIKA